jgi:hypothetical protein
MDAGRPLTAPESRWTNVRRRTWGKYGQSVPDLLIQRGERVDAGEVGTDARAPHAMDGRRFPHLRRALTAPLAALALSGMLAAGPARADDSPATRWPVGGSTLRLAMGMATEHWGMSPCRGRVALSWAGLGSGTNAQSSWAAGGADPFAAPSRNSDCEIALSLQAEWDWPKLCTVVVHEVGHLTGHDHVDDPEDVMFYSYVAPVPECAATAEPVETGPPPPVPAAAAAPAPAPAVKKPLAKKAAEKTVKKAAKKPAKRKRTQKRAAQRHR